MKELQIKDLYAGKPDAKDEKSEVFLKTYVVSDYFDIDSLIHKDKCFITGLKGSGKTALLYYIEDRILSIDESSCTSFVYFKDEYPDIKRQELHTISRKIVSSITIDSGALLHNDDFEYIWRWLFYKRIISDNEDNKKGLFVNDIHWKSFEKTMHRIKDPINTKKMSIPRSIKLSMPIKNPQADFEYGPEIEINLGDTKHENYRQFIKIIDEAENTFSKVKRTDIPYYICIDELEAYYGEEDTFKRDLGLIRDLIFTVKRINVAFQSNQFQNTKIICSVRSEILNAITRFVVTKELNKVTSGFSVPLTWNYTNNNSYAHPLIQIILKRIAICSEESEENMHTIYNKWFPEQIHNIEPAAYILNNSWCKPRDMVRFLMTAQNSIHRNESSFTQAVFDSLSKEYSAESLTEITEELRALYSPEQLDTIITCFTGYKVSFSYLELQARVDQYFPDTILKTNLTAVLNDLYRLGFLGNYFPATKTYHWLHKGDGRLILSEDWRLFIHYALHNALSLRTKNDKVMNRKVGVQIGDRAQFTVDKVIFTNAYGHFIKYGKEYKGKIHVSEFKKLNGGKYIDSLPDFIHEGEVFDVIIKDRPNEYGQWRLTIADDDTSQSK